MKKIRCPKCDEFIVFDEDVTKTSETVVFKCEHCGHVFKVRFKLKDKENVAPDFGQVVVLENVFTHKQIFPLHLGDNVFGRRNPGDNIDCPIVTADPSMDRRHCIVNVQEKAGKLLYKVRDCGSNVGTFVSIDILGDREQRNITDGTVVSLGDTTLILKEVGNVDNE